MSFGISPVTPTIAAGDNPPATSDGFPRFIQFQNSGTDLGEPDVDTVNFASNLTATRGTGENANRVTVTGLPFAGLRVDEFTCTDGQTVFALSTDSGTSRGQYTVVLDGFVLRSTDYLVSGTTLTLLSATSAGQQLSVRYAVALPIGAVDASQVTYTPAGTGATATDVQTKLRESMSLADKGGDVTGVASAVTPLTNLFAESIGLLVIGTGTYDIPTDVTPAARDLHLVVDPTADFSGAGLLRLDNQIPFQGTPVFSHDLVRKDFGAEWAPYTNAFLRASYAQASADGVAVVAVFGGADARGADANCWGGNFVSYANHASGTAIGIELNYGVLVSGGLAYGLVIASAGNFQPQTAISVLANNVASQPINGVDFAWRETEGCVTGALIYSNGAVGATCQYFMRLTNVVASVAEIDIPSLAVEATQTGAANRVSIRGGAASSPPIISAKGSDTNINLEVRGKGTGRVQFVNNGATNFEAGSINQPDYLRANAGTGGAQLTAQGASSNVDVVLVGKGTGGVRLQDGAATTVIRINTTGLGFFGATPAAKPTGVAVTAAGVHAALVTLGLIAA